MRRFSPRALPVPVALTITAPLGCAGGPPAPSTVELAIRSGSLSYTTELARGR